MTLVAVMPYCGRCPNVGRLETGPKRRAAPSRAVDGWDRVGLSSRPW
jgi:hypothetical protein